MKRFNSYIFIFCMYIVLTPFSTGFCESKGIPWSQRHFPNIPKVTAEQAMQLKTSGMKIILLDVPWTMEGYNNGHICGAVIASTEADKLDRLIRKIPKDYVILSY